MGSAILPEQPVTDDSELDPERHGVVVRDAHGRRGVLLHGVPGVASSSEALDIERRKAGISPGARST